MATVSTTTNSGGGLKLPSTAPFILMFCCFLVVGVTIVLFNLLTVTTLMINSHLRKRRMYLVVNLALSDLLTGATLVPALAKLYGSTTCIIPVPVTWLMGTIFTIVINVYASIALQILIAIGAVALVTLTSSYATAFINVKKQRQLHNQSDLQRTIQKERELAKTLLLVTITSLLTWLPLIGAGMGPMFPSFDVFDNQFEPVVQSRHLHV
ncbi:predicted protein [Nematostella vectensis]|uniref:G-protein coupled receptors family 1 profile domain-containing protein n=1 Tax=Nematostella vectensis TaxID=45351 RepID=A7RM54_NEMVE|nr:predicted protein [Nematostella vectensis]|eukprot:XP_001639506.1 predicted protein [Nematostella vectensis]